MSFEDYLKSKERKNLYTHHPLRNFLGPISGRLSERNLSDVINWAEKYNNGVIPDYLK